MIESHRTRKGLVAMIVIPAIDIKDGRCVRLTQGDFSRLTVYADDPVYVAKIWRDMGAERIHVVDLDGSREGIPRNSETIRRIVREVNIPIQVGGGIRSIETITMYLEMGVSRVILGTMALRDKAFIRNASETFAKSIMLSIDARDGMVAVEGWTEQTSERAVEVAQRFQDLPIDAIVYTDISRDGMQTGVNVEATSQFAQSVDLPVIASGGVSHVRDIEKLKEIEKFGVIGVIIGKALYTGAVSLREAIERTR